MHKPSETLAKIPRREKLRRAQEGSGDGALPDFVVIGAQKSGTSAFYALLKRHPLVRPAIIKEIHYFDYEPRFAKGLPWYRRCFPEPSIKEERKTLTGEATPGYLFNPRVPERMAEAIPQARLVALLRNPVDRAYSHYQMHVREDIETRSFEEAIGEEIAGEKGRPYLARGLYAEQLERFSSYAERGRLLVLKSEDFFARRKENLDRTLAFLGLPSFAPPPKRNNSKDRYAPMDPATRQRLEVFFEPHNRRLYDYLGIDFGW